MLRNRLVKAGIKIVAQQEAEILRKIDMAKTPEELIKAVLMLVPKNVAKKVEKHINKKSSDAEWPTPEDEPMTWQVEADFDEEMALALKIEKEHKGTIEQIIKDAQDDKLKPLKEYYKMIGSDHYKEFPNYYSAGLVPMEKSLKAGKKKEGKK